MTAPIRSQSELLDAIRARRDELNISHETIDDIAGFAKGYTSKLLAPEPMKNLGPMSLGALIGALGIALVAVPDPDAARMVEKRWIKRKRPQRLPEKLTLLAAALSTAKDLNITPELAAQTARKEHMRMLGKIGGLKGGSKGGKRRLKTMKKRARQQAASHAARIRWGKKSPCTTVAG